MSYGFEDEPVCPECGERHPQYGPNAVLLRWIFGWASEVLGTVRPPPVPAPRPPKARGTRRGRVLRLPPPPSHGGRWN